MPEPTPEQQLAQLTQEYVSSLPKQLEEINSAWQHLQHVNWDVQMLAKMQLASHSLVGSGASYGFPNISTAAKRLDQQLRQLRAHARPVERQQVNDFIAQLGKAITQATHLQLSGAGQKAPDAELTIKSSANTFCIAIIEDDRAQANFLKSRLQQIGYETQLFADPNAFASDITKRRYDLILLDISFPDGPLEGLFWLEKVHNQLQSHSPIMIMSARSDLVARMRALRAGASAYLAKPVDMAELAKQIALCLHEQTAVKPRVLWIDDDTKILALYKTLLSEAGFLVEVLSQPLKLLEKLELFRPDALIMDYEMPGCNGAELAAMLRQDARFMTLPIIFASGSSKALAEKDHLSIVGNEFLSKPVDIALLQQVLKTQLAKAKFVSARIQQISQRIEKNGLQTKHYFLEQLESLLSQDTSRAANQRCFLVYLTLDKEDYLKERYGLRAMVDLTEKIELDLACMNAVNGEGCVIGSVSYLLILTLPKTMDDHQAIKPFQTALQQLEWPQKEGATPLTFSLGVVPLEVNLNLDQTVAKAEQACFAAVQAGGNKIEWAKSDAQREEMLNAQIRSLMQAQAFKLFFQPIVDLESGDTLFEALIRLVDQDGHIYTPNQFLPWIDSDLEGGTDTLDRWLIDHSIAEITKLTQDSLQKTTVIVKIASNLSQMVGLLPYIRFSIQSARLNETDRIIFALSESVVVKNVHKAKQIIEALKELGCGFMLEQVDVNDISAQLISDLHSVDFAKLKLGINVPKAQDKLIIQTRQNKPGAPVLVATGIEDSAILAQYWDLGVRYFQGYFIQEPGEAMLYDPM